MTLSRTVSTMDSLRLGSSVSMFAIEQMTPVGMGRGKLGQSDFAPRPEGPEGSTSSVP